MINLKSFIKNFGMLEFLVISSIVYVVSMLIWTASTRESVEAKANSIKQNYSKIVTVLNNEIDKCSQNPESSTIWNESCGDEWTSKSVVEYLIKNIKLSNPYNNKMQLIQPVTDPRIQAEGEAGQSTNKGIIFISLLNFSSESGSEWIIGTCIKSPCVAAGNNELVSIYR